MLCYGYYSAEARELLSDASVDRVLLVGEIDDVGVSAFHEDGASILESVARVLLDDGEPLLAESAASYLSVESTVKTFAYNTVKAALRSAARSSNVIMSVVVSDRPAGPLSAVRVWVSIYDLGMLKLTIDLNVCALD